MRGVIVALALVCVASSATAAERGAIKGFEGVPWGASIEVARGNLGPQARQMALAGDPNSTVLYKPVAIFNEHFVANFIFSNKDGLNEVDLVFLTPTGDVDRCLSGCYSRMKAMLPDLEKAFGKPDVLTDTPDGKDLRLEVEYKFLGGVELDLLSLPANASIAFVTAAAK